MSRDILDSKRNPVNRTAAAVLKKGEHWQPNTQGNGLDSDLPLATVPLHELDANQRNQVIGLIGHRFGRFTVMGYAAERAGKYPLYVVRCSCGTYSYRRKKAITNPANARTDACDSCRHLLFIQKRDHWQRTGIDIEYNVIDDLMYDKVRK